MVEQLETFIGHSFWLAPIVALLAGIITSFTPCCLSNVSLIIGFIGGTGSHKTKNAFGLSLIYVLGSTVVFVILGTAASLLGRVVELESSLWFLILGVLMVGMSLQLFGIIHIVPHFHFITKNPRRGYAGAFITGMLGGVFSSSCAVPVIVVLLAIAMEKSNPLWGVLLMLLYSIGHGGLTVFAGTSVGFIKNIESSKSLGSFGDYLNKGLALFILLIGLFMFYLAFFHVH